jgi:hypothetical protein
MESEIKGLVKGLVEEVIRADMSMHASQVEAWTWMAAHCPKGEHIPRDIFKGIPQSRYLSMNEVVLKMFLKPVPMQTYWQRIKLWQWFKQRTGFFSDKSRVRARRPFIFEFCSAGENGAQSITITIKRLENGKIKADYSPADALTADLMTE